MNEVNWGILGCGGIANKFAVSLLALNSGKLAACASRTIEKAGEFADRHRIEKRYSTYNDLVNDPGIDAIYIATPHNFHYEQTKLCLEHGKHVLCEKPFTVNAAQASELTALAKEKNRFLMEGVWTRFLPAVQKLKELLAEGVIGEVKTVRADFCFASGCGPEHRLLNPDLAGGALLDVGIYPIHFASIIFGKQPIRIQSSAVIGKTGVDEISFYLFEYGNGKTAQLSSSVTTQAPVDAIVSGEQGYIRIPHFLGAKTLEIRRKGAEPETLEFPCPDMEMFKYEIAHAMECIAAGKTESEILPHSETLAILKTMDALRAEWGLKYPGE